MPTNEELIALAAQPAEAAMRLHPVYRGKIQTMLKCPVRDFGDFAIWYTPGVAAPCKAIRDEPDLVFEYTNKSNTIAIISDGTRVLGLGDIGPEAGLPVMEGKSLLFKYLGGVDAVPLCLGTTDSDDLVRAVQWLQPSFGGVNLEDISQPKCFDILDRLRAAMKIPVWHDDQQGTATVLLAGIIGALKIVDKRIDAIKIAMIGVGAANVATYRLLQAAGVNPAGIVACDTQGTLHTTRTDIEQLQDQFADKWKMCIETNENQVQGGIREALRGADVCIAFSASGPGIIEPSWVKSMADNAVVFACANPVPEIWPWEAKQAGARIVATGRSDFPNQINNSLGFPGIFRGVLDVRARTITDEMTLEAASEIARAAEAGGLSEDRIVPRLDEWEIVPRIAAATAMKAQEQAVAELTKSHEQLVTEATETISQSRQAVEVLMREGIIGDHREGSQ